jgi:hypothetical protein
MKDKKSGLLFPELDKSEKKQKTKKSRQESLFHSVLNKIHSAKERQMRLKIIKGVAKSSQPWVSEALMQSLDDPSEEIRGFIINELGNRESLDLNLLYQRLQRPPWYAKTGCLEILRLRRAASSVEHIANLINDSNIEVRRILAAVLGEIGNDKAMALLAKLTKDSSPFVRKSAQQALQKASQLKSS